VKCYECNIAEVYLEVSSWVFRNQIHEGTFSLRFLGIILRILQLELFGFLKFRKGGMVFYQVFPLSPLLCTVTLRKRLCESEQICKRLREFEEIEISRQSCGGDCE
jgi:hypothetical protein